MGVLDLVCYAIEFWLEVHEHCTEVDGEPILGEKNVGTPGAFPADGVAEENSKKVDHIVAPEAPSGKAHLLSDLAQDTVLAKRATDQHNFPKSARGRGVGFRIVWIFIEVSAILVMPTSLLRSVVCFLFKEAYFYTD
jgi:hypothetical protein